MSKTLYVPEHIAQRIAAKKAKDAEQSGVGAAYVDSSARVLDPSLLEKSLLDRLPQPTGWRILVMPYKGKDKTDGGLILPDQVREREALATVVAYVLRIGQLSYCEPNKCGDNPEP